MTLCYWLSGPNAIACICTSTNRQQQLLGSNFVQQLCASAHRILGNVAQAGRFANYSVWTCDHELVGTWSDHKDFEPFLTPAEQFMFSSEFELQSKKDDGCSCRLVVGHRHA
jgi:hypothetical protein